MLLKSDKVRIISVILGKNVESESGLRWAFALEISI